MLPYTVGRFRSILENRSLTSVEQRKLARFANKYYSILGRMFHFGTAKAEAANYVRQFLLDSTLPYEVKRDIAQLSEVERVKVACYEVVTIPPLTRQEKWEATAERFNQIETEIQKLGVLEKIYAEEDKRARQWWRN